MSDAYRSGAVLCPVCPNAALRVFNERLVCDECQGMLLDPDDFAASIREIDGSEDALVATDTGSAGKLCPHCKQMMTTCKLKLGSFELKGPFLRCSSHGIWVPRAAMTATFAKASRRSGFKGLGSTSSIAAGLSGAPNNVAANVANMPSGHSGMSGAMAGIASAFGGGAPASSGLAISHWAHHKPRAHTLFVSAHKGQTLGCPACFVELAYQGDRWACSSCSGLFVENEALVAMVQEMALTAWEMPALSGKEGSRPCPICKTAMIVELLEAVTIDRCADHGVWFDNHELEQTLHHASAPASGLGPWLKRLFSRSGAKG
ncbi:MAG TPA: zf-TFIIB domain-containing protein [Kofleriaceae bacterium]|nr:zf-TFIIB domain-containing protein [Kofleriaceae bacterium]